MAINWTRYRSIATGKPLAKTRVDFTIDRGDLVEAAKQAMGDMLPYDADRLAVSIAAKRLTKTKIEEVLAGMLVSYGGMWLESNSEDYLTVDPDVLPLIRDYAEQRVEALWPGLS